jgi:hypothetical protein
MSTPGAYFKKIPGKKIISRLLKNVMSAGKTRQNSMK